MVLPIMAYRESPPTPESDTAGVFRLHVYEREEISLVEVISIHIDCNI